MGAMDNPLENPFPELVDEAGGKPQLTWRLAGAVAGIVGAIVTRKLLEGLRREATDDGEPNGGNQRMGWSYALVWAGVMGVGASLGQMVAQRIVAAAWKRRHD
jgi:Protein of unknown function (DUF4235)